MLKALLWSIGPSIFLSFGWLMLIILVFALGTSNTSYQSILQITVLLGKFVPNLWYVYLVSIDVIQGVQPILEASLISIVNADWLVAILVYGFSFLLKNDNNFAMSVVLIFMIVSLVAQITMHVYEIY